MIQTSIQKREWRKGELFQNNFNLLKTMTQITASAVNNLRKETGAGMMDCKNALVDAEGDFEKAIDILRKKGQKIAALRVGREAKEGYITAKTCPASDGRNKGVILILNCETDFVARNKEFVNFADAIADLALETRCDSIEEIKSSNLLGSTVQEGITALIGKIGEKIDLSLFAKIEGASVTAYNHPGNRLATLLGFNKTTGNIEQLGKDVAMQIAAMNPIAVDQGDVSQDIIDRELAIGREQAVLEGKPEQMADKIAMGKLNKFYKECTLLNQEFIKDNKKTIRQYLNETDKDLSVTSFYRFAL